VLDPDVGHPTRAHLFGEKYPEKYIQTGVAEQNMVGVAAGLASCGLVPYVVCFSAFLARRCFDQIYNSILFPRVNVKLVGSYCGFTTHGTGASHQTFDDIAIMATLPGIVIINVGDPKETAGAIRAAAEYAGPVYIRVGRIDNIESFYGDDDEFAIGRIQTVETGSDAVILSTGFITATARESVGMLRDEGFSIALYHMPTLKPFDRRAVMSIIRGYRHIFTVEDGNTAGGLGGLINRIVAGEGLESLVTNIGVDDRFGKCGTLSDLYSYFGLSCRQIADKVKGRLLSGAKSLQ
jgi:transketolase